MLLLSFQKYCIEVLKAVVAVAAWHISATQATRPFTYRLLHPPGVVLQRPKQPQWGRDIHCAMSSIYTTTMVHYIHEKIPHNQSTMFRVVHPLYPTADIPSITQNTECTRRTNSIKMLCPQYSLLTRIVKGHNITPSHTRVDILKHRNH